MSNHQSIQFFEAYLLRSVAREAIRRLRKNRRITYIENSNTLVDMKGAMTSAAIPVLNNTMITDQSVSDYTANPAGPGAERVVDCLEGLVSVLLGAMSYGFEEAMNGACGSAPGGSGSLRV